VVVAWTHASGGDLRGYLCVTGQPCWSAASGARASAVALRQPKRG
jgi:hypothetical protein